MNHAMAIRTQDREVGFHIVGDGYALLERRDRLEVMRFDEARTDLAIACLKIEIAGLGGEALRTIGSGSTVPAPPCFSFATSNTSANAIDVPHSITFCSALWAALLR